MSTDFYASCDKCQSYMHVGQRYTNISCFGLSLEDEFGRSRAARYVAAHIHHGMKLSLNDIIPSHYKNEEKELERFEIFGMKFMEDFWRPYDTKEEAKEDECYQYAIYDFREQQVLEIRNL